MTGIFDSWHYLAAAAVLALAGILGAIDQTSMIILVVVLMAMAPAHRRSCARAKGPGA